MSAPLRRRDLLVRAVRLGAGGAIALAVQPLGCGGSPAERIDLSLLLPEPADARDVGRAYLARFPAEADREALADALLAESPPAAAGGLRAHFAARILDDHAARRWFRYRGWLLSRSEGRLCALAALDAPPARNRGADPSAPARSR